MNTILFKGQHALKLSKKIIIMMVAIFSMLVTETTTGQSVDWGSFYGSTVVDNELVNIRTDYAWNCGTISTNILSACDDGEIELASVTKTNIHRMFGFSTTTTSSWQMTIKYGIYLKNNGHLYIVHNSTNFTDIATYSVGDNLIIKKQGNQLSLIQNCTVIHTMTVTPEAFRVEGRLYTPGTSLEELTVRSGSHCIDWTGFYESNVTNNELVNTRTSDFWSAAVSTEILSASDDGSIELASVTKTNIHRIFGLSTASAGSFTTSNIKYGFYLKTGGILNTVINGDAHGLIGTYSIGDKLVIKKQGDLLSLIQNGTVIDTFTVIPEDYRVEGKIWNHGESLETLRLTFNNANVFSPTLLPTWVETSRMNIVSDVLTSVGSNNWCNGTRSTEETGFISPFGYRYDISEINKHKIIGFSSVTGVCFGATEYGFMTAGTTLYWVEGAQYTSVGSYAIGDIISMECDGTTIIWKHNCNIVRQNQIDRTSKYHLNTHLYYTGTTLKDVYVWGMGTNVLRTSEPTDIISTEKEQIVVSLLPNPSNGIFNIECNNKIDEVQVYNSNGALISSNQSIGDNVLKLNISDNSAGIYVVRIKAGNKYFTKKIIVK